MRLDTRHNAFKIDGEGRIQKDFTGADQRIARDLESGKDFIRIAERIPNADSASADPKAKALRDKVLALVEANVAQHSADTETLGYWVEDHPSGTITTPPAK